MVKKVIFFLLIGSLCFQCVRKDAKCKREHKAAKKKGTAGWKY